MVCSLRFGSRWYQGSTFPSMLPRLLHGSWLKPDRSLKGQAGYCFVSCRACMGCAYDNPGENLSLPAFPFSLALQGPIQLHLAFFVLLYKWNARNVTCLSDESSDKLGKSLSDHLSDKHIKPCQTDRLTMPALVFEPPTETPLGRSLAAYFQRSKILFKGKIICAV